MKEPINPSEAVPDLKKLAFNTTFPVDSQSYTCLWSLFHLEFSALFRFLIFFSSALTGKKESNHKDLLKKQETKIKQLPTEKLWNDVLLQKLSAFLCKKQYLDSVMVALVLQNVPEELSPEQEGESTKIAGDLPESACTGLQWCDCAGTWTGSILTSACWIPYQKGLLATDLLYQTAPASHP